MATKLQLYNTALRYCRERKVTLTEDRKPRRLLDDVWDQGGVDDCLESGQWKFAMRAVKIDADTTIDRQFGFTYAFSKPTDWVITSAVCSDEYYDMPLIRYAHENDYWYADIDVMYVKYVSNHADYGNNMSLWPQTFFRYVAASFANEIVDDLTSNEETIASVERRLAKNELKAKNKDAMNQPQRFAAPGNWSSSRGRLRGVNMDRGNRGSLLG
jgi:hypothetical protein